MRIPFSSLSISDKRLRIILGDRGSGKTNTALAIAERLRKAELEIDFVIPSSRKLEYELEDGFRIRSLPSDLRSWKKYVGGLRNRIVVLDEGLIAVNARNWRADFGTTIAKLSAVSRHVDVYVIVTTQAHLVDRLLRLLADAIVIKRTSISKLAIEDSPPKWLKRINDALVERSRNTISIDTIPVDEAVVIAEKAYYVTGIPKSKYIEKLSTWANEFGIRLRCHDVGKVFIEVVIRYRMIEPRFRNLRKAYVKRSREKYSKDRKPLVDEASKTVTVYAHDLDGCPLRAVFERTKSIPRIRKANFDRGDSFEVGFGVVHGLPAGLEVAVDVTDIVSDIVPEGYRVYLHGTPDFVLIDDDTLVVLDAKSPLRRKPEDGAKGYRTTRMRTYSFLLHRYRETFSDSGAARLAVNGIRMPHPKSYVVEAAKRTRRPVAKEWVRERDSGKVRTYVVVASPETGTYHEVRIDEDDNDVVERLRRFTRAIFDPESVVEYVKKFHESDERKRECRYCPKIDCGLSTSETKTFKIASREPYTSVKNGRRYAKFDHVYVYEDGEWKPLQSDSVKFEIRDWELRERITNSRHVSFYAKARLVKSGAVDVYRIYRRMPTSLYDE